VTDIPEFTIGPGALNGSVTRADKDTVEKSSKNSASRDEEAPFKSL
jgi:hypothetical protein